MCHDLYGQSAKTIRQDFSHVDIYSHNKNSTAAFKGLRIKLNNSLYNNNGSPFPMLQKHLKEQKLWIKNITKAIGLQFQHTTLNEHAIIPKVEEFQEALKRTMNEAIISVLREKAKSNLGFDKENIEAMCNRLIVAAKAKE